MNNELDALLAEFYGLRTLEISGHDQNTTRYLVLAEQTKSDGKKIKTGSEILASMNTIQLRGMCKYMVREEDWHPSDDSYDPAYKQVFMCLDKLRDDEWSIDISTYGGYSWVVDLIKDDDIHRGKGKGFCSTACEAMRRVILEGK